MKWVLLVAWLINGQPHTEIVAYGAEDEKFCHMFGKLYLAAAALQGASHAMYTCEQVK